MKRTTVALAVVALLGLHLAADGEKFTEWSAPVNLGKIVNSPYAEAGAYISRDGLSLYFGSGRPGGVGPTNTFDIWVSHRESPASQWRVPVNVGAMVNTANNEQTPMLTIDGHRLYFARDGSGGYGSQDLYVSRRQHQWEDTGWREPVNLGPGVNTAAEESGPSIIEDDQTGVLSLYFSSTRATGMGLEDIYVSMAYPGEPFGPAVLESLLSGPVSGRAALRSARGVGGVLRLESVGLVRHQRGPLDLQPREPVGAMVGPGKAAGCAQQHWRRCAAGPLIRWNRTLLPLQPHGDARRERHLRLHSDEDHGARQEVASRTVWHTFGSSTGCAFALRGHPRGGLRRVRLSRHAALPSGRRKLTNLSLSAKPVGGRDPIPLTG